MKALQLRSPLHLHYSDTNLDAVDVRIFVSQDLTTFDVANDPSYLLTSQAINNEVTFEIAELIRSKNQYYYNKDFYTNRDTATYVLVFAQLVDDNGDLIENKYQLLKVRDGYVSREETSQLLFNEITENINNWNTLFNSSITVDQTDAFQNDSAYLVEDANDSEAFVISEPVGGEGVYTFSVMLKSNSEGNLFSLGKSNSNGVTFNISTKEVTSTIGDIIAYDITEVDTWVKISVVLSINNTDAFRIGSEQGVNPESVFVFNPTAIKGNWLHVTPDDLLLQDNTTIKTADRITPKIMFDKKYIGGIYRYGIENLTFPDNKQSFVDDLLISTTASLAYTNLEGTIESLVIKGIEECEHKYTAQKLSFLNKYGVIQDFIFFRKRVDEVKTDSKDYKANVLQNGRIYPHIGTNQIFKKTSERSVTLNSGFYSESFNSVFEQILNSLYYWINNEPCVLTSSSWTKKTRLNDKLINYTFDFKYGNNDINNIR